MVMNALAIVCAVLTLASLVGLGIYVYTTAGAVEDLRKRHVELQQRTLTMMDMGEFRDVDPELKDLYRRTVVDIVWPSLLRILNEPWRSLTPAQRSRVAGALEAEARKLRDALGRLPTVSGISDGDLDKALAGASSVTKPALFSIAATPMVTRAPVPRPTFRPKTRPPARPTTRPTTRPR
jgi:hypothetical protein